MHVSGPGSLVCAAAAGKLSDLGKCGGCMNHSDSAGADVWSRTAPPPANTGPPCLMIMHEALER